VIDIETFEQGFLGCLLLTAEQGKKPETRLVPEDFADSLHRRVFETILRQFDEGIRPDLITVARALPDANPALIAGLTNTVPSAVNLPYYEAQIYTESRKRRFVREVKTAAANAQEYGADMDAVISALAERLLAETAAGIKGVRYMDWDGYEQECLRYDPAKDFPLFSTGVRCPNGTLSYIGARPGGGKTTMLINIARDALAQGRRAFFLNLEMSNKQIITNLILSRMYAGQKNALEREKIENPLALYYGLFKDSVTAPAGFVKARLNGMKAIAGVIGKTLFVYDGIGQTLNGILTAVRAETQPGDVVLVDYVQRLPVAGNVQRYLEIKAGSNALLELAVRNGLVVIAGAQLNRKAEDGEASLADFREGGDIEADAHNALAVEKDYLHVLKAREGKSGQRIALEWRKEYCFMQSAGEYLSRGGAEEQTEVKKPKRSWKDL
jgi:replicative DNA helicase